MLQVKEKLEHEEELFSMRHMLELVDIDLRNSFTGRSGGGGIIAANSGFADEKLMSLIIKFPILLLLCTEFSMIPIKHQKIFIFF